MNAQPTETTQPVIAVQAINQVMQAVKFVGKDQRNTAPGQGNYEYRGIDAVLAAVGPALRDAGVIVVLDEVLSVDYLDVEVGRNKSLMTSVRVRCRYRWYGPGGDFIDAESLGEAFDSGDKATGKAITYAYRDTLTKTLSLPVGDPDADANTYERTARGGHEPAGRTHGRIEPEQDPRTHVTWDQQIKAAAASGLPAVQALWRTAKANGASDTIMTLITEAGNALTAAHTPPAPTTGHTPEPRTAEQDKLRQEQAKWSTKLNGAVNSANANDIERLVTEADKKSKASQDPDVIQSWELLAARGSEELGRVYAALESAPTEPPPF